MNDWDELRTVALIAVWLTVAGGLTLAALWLKSGGARAIGPEDEIMSEAGAAVGPKNGKVTSFSSAQVGIHGVLALMTAILATHALTRHDDRGSGYVAVLIAIAVTAIPGLLMFWKWRTGARPKVRNAAAASRARAEDHLPRPVVYLHGLLAISFAALLVALVVLD
jgi:uncharacterized iron-regulated membrane protein